MSKIKNVYAREVLDSRGNPTVEAIVTLESGVSASAIVPSGASTGEREAIELRDGGKRYMGKGVLMAVNNVNTILQSALIGKDSLNQREIDETMLKIDGTDNKSNIGANAILAVSLANLKVASIYKKLPLYKYLGDEYSMPVAMMNILNGGMHADNKLDFQEFMIIPNAKEMKERIRIGSEVFHTLKNVLKENGYNTNVGDEGGFAPNFKTNKEALDAIITAILKAGYKPGIDVNLALDVAASEFYKEGTYFLEGKEYTSDELLNYYEELVNEYPIISIEDPFDENDWEAFTKITDKLGDKISIVGDDLFVTNKKYLQKGIDKKAGNAILIKINQIGTISETLDTIKLAKENGYKTIISHRSGETEDTSIADLAVGLNLGQIKTGSLSRTDRICKYNRLIRIEDELTDCNFF